MIYSKELMIKDVVSVDKGTSLVEASKQMVDKGISSIVIMEDEKPVGIITEKDFNSKIISKGEDYKNKKVDDIMTKELITVGPKATISEICVIFKEKKIKKLLVVENDKLLGIVSLTDLVYMLTGDK